MSKDDNAQARERLGQVLRDRWLLEQVLGVGGMASVYAARHRNGARAAIKLLHGPVREDPVIKERFMREAYIANTVGHPGVPRVLDDDEDAQLGPYLIMELLEGESLDEVFKRQEKLPHERVLDIADQVLDVLAAAHDRGIVHRDLKPGNVFLCRDGSVRVLDFGIARLMHEQSARLTATGMMMGTPAYMSPEQARTSGRLVDGRSDVYSVGATMFRVLAGRHVHQGKMAHLIVQVATERAPKLFSVAPTVPLAICAIVDRSIEFEPERRYSSAREMQTDVRDVRSGRPPRVAANSLPVAPPIPDLEPSPGSRRSDPGAPPSRTPESAAAERARLEAKAAAANADFQAQRSSHGLQAPQPNVAMSPPQSAPPAERFKATMMQVAPSEAQPPGRATGNLASTMYQVSEATPVSTRDPRVQNQPWSPGYPAPPPSPSYVPPVPAHTSQPIAAQPSGWSTGPQQAMRTSNPMPMPMPMPMPTGAPNATAKKSSRAGCALLSFLFVLLLAAGAVYAIRYLGVALP